MRPSRCSRPGVIDSLEKVLLQAQASNDSQYMLLSADMLSELDLAC